MSGETLDVGVDTGAPVGPYPHRFPFTGTIERIEIELQPALDAAARRAVRAGRAARRDGVAVTPPCPRPRGPEGSLDG